MKDHDMSKISIRDARHERGHRQASDSAGMDSDAPRL